MKATVRKYQTVVEETLREIGIDIDPPTRKATAMAVIANPFAGHYQEDLSLLMDIGAELQEDLSLLMDIGAELGDILGRKAVAALGIDPTDAQSYGKAAIVGSRGELEHAAAILHPKLGAPLRAAVGKGAALVPSVKKMGDLGSAIDVPLGHKDAAYVRSHFDGMEVRISDAPRAGEIVVCVAVTDSGRPLPRVGGLTHEEDEGKDGLR